MLYDAGVMVRTLSLADLPALMELKTAAGWNQTEDDWKRYLSLAPEGCFGIECEGTVAASATVMCYGEDLAWIGMVLTLPRFRGRGFARALMEVCIDQAGSRPTRLDASDMGRPLYESMGFVAECPIERVRREPAPGPQEPAVQPLEFDISCDTMAFGADRSLLLLELAKDGGASVDGAYAFERPGSDAFFLGPWMAGSPESAERLLRWFVARRGSTPSVIDLFPDHQHAASLAGQYGFRTFRRLTRMVRAPGPVLSPDPRIYGIAGFEWG